MGLRRVKVYNDNQQVPKWTESFKGVDITIEYGKPLEMDFYDAHEFKGQYFPMKLLGDDKTQDPKTMKMIRVEQVDLNLLNKEVEKTMGYTCNACKQTFSTVSLLTKHTTHDHANLEVVHDPLLEDELVEKKTKLKRGRPSKQDSAQV